MRGIDRLGSREEERFGSGVVCSEQWDEIGERGDGRRLFMATAKRRGGEGIPCRRAVWDEPASSSGRGRLCNLEGRAGSVMEKFYPTGLGLESGPAQVSLAAVSRREFSRLGLPTARSFLLDDESGS